MLGKAHREGCHCGCCQSLHLDARLGGALGLCGDGDGVLLSVQLQLHVNLHTELYGLNRADCRSCLHALHWFSASVLRLRRQRDVHLQMQLGERSVAAHQQSHGCASVQLVQRAVVGFLIHSTG